VAEGDALIVPLACGALELRLVTGEIFHLEHKALTRID